MAETLTFNQADSELLDRYDAELTASLGQLTTFEAFAAEASANQTLGLPEMLGTGFTSPDGSVDTDK